MPAPDWEDLGVFLQTDEFAVTATLYPRDGAARAVSVIFDDPTLLTAINDYGVETVKPTIQGRPADFADMRKGDEVDLSGVRYVLDSRPRDDGTGWVTVTIYRADGL